MSAVRSVLPCPSNNVQMDALHHRVIECNRCPRLRDYCSEVAREKRRAYVEWNYWGKPVPGFGDPEAQLWIVGLAPGAHGANRTGRVFTGDNSGHFLFAALHRLGLANQPKSTDRNDGLVLSNCYISATARCAPPGNKPLPAEVANCSGYLDDEWALLKQKRSILALGRIAWDASLALARRQGCAVSTVPFAHAAEVQLSPTLQLIGSYHVSQQNTFTGRLTNSMFDAVLRKCLS